jgi:hypothetical protein
MNIIFLEYNLEFEMFSQSWKEISFNEWVTDQQYVEQRCRDGHYNLNFTGKRHTGRPKTRQLSQVLEVIIRGSKKLRRKYCRALRLPVHPEA